jgi:hypothetical protein
MAFTVLDAFVCLPALLLAGRAVSMKHRLRTLLCCVILEAGALAGVPMRPEQIRELLHALNVPKVARADPDRPMDGATP